MYYILQNELEKPKFDAHLEGPLINSEGELMPNIFGKGKSLKKTADKGYSIAIDDTYSLSGKLRDRLSVCVHNSDNLFIISEKAQHLLDESLHAQVEFYPFYFTYNNIFISNYKIVNILNQVDCVDSKESKIDFGWYDDNDIGQGSIYTIDGLVLDTSLIPQHLNIFLLGRREDAIIVVHERLVDKVKKLSLSGFVFCKPEDFRL